MRPGRVNEVLTPDVPDVPDDADLPNGPKAARVQLTPRRVEGLPDLPVLFLAAGGDHSIAVLKQPTGRTEGADGEDERVAIGPSPRRSHGRGVAPMMPLPPGIFELCSAAAAAMTSGSPVSAGGRPGGASASAAVGSCDAQIRGGAGSSTSPGGTARLVSAVEDLFSSPGAVCECCLQILGQYLSSFYINK